MQSFFKPFPFSQRATTSNFDRASTTVLKEPKKNWSTKKKKDEKKQNKKNPMKVTIVHNFWKGKDSCNDFHLLLSALTFYGRTMWGLY